MLGDLMNELRGLRDEAHYGQRTRVITVAKPFCAPARGIITGALQQYGVKMYGYRDQIKTISPRAWARQQGVIADAPLDMAGEKLLPLATVAEVTVSEQAAAWAEYLLLRTGKLYCPNGYVNARNEAWAKRHGGQMPPAWNEGKPWIEKSCSEGMKAWAPLRDAAKKRKR